MNVHKLCYFCDEIYNHTSCFISNYYEVWICSNCKDFKLPINYNIQENGECPICFEDKILIKLPTCIHKICLGCCKTIYFGSTTKERPIHYSEITDEHPLWPYEITNKNCELEDKKQEEYYYFEDTHFDYKTKTYDELVIIRNNLITERPEWMNTEAFINYENNTIKYQIQILNIEKDCDDYNENKTKGNSSCPLCRIKPY
jgi:hypothetical protein